MRVQHNCGEARRALCAAGLLAAAMICSGCGMPGAPQPPSLNLPERVKDLSAVRAGNQVALTWTMPDKTTDKVELKAPVTVHICRNPTGATACNVATTLQLDPKSDGSYTDALPQALAAGSPRLLTYSVELVNRKGRSAGLSNSSDVLAGAAPPAIDGLTAEAHKDGVLLHWTVAPSGSPSAAVRLQRRLLTPPAKPAAKGALAPPVEPTERNLMVEASPPGDRALDRDIHFGETYEYRAQRVENVPLNGRVLELTSAFSSPIRVDAADVFPPAVPRGLAAVATAGENGSSAAIDLSWLPGTEADLAGYFVYRREDGAGGANTGTWQRISPVKPLAGPGFRDTAVQTGHSYRYSVTSIGQNGHESARSAETQETVPTP